MANVSVELRAYHNCDDVQLFWMASKDGKFSKLVGCLGFTIERQRQDKHGNWKTEILRNRVGFKQITAPDPDQSLTQPSTIWPFQCYTWTDHGANNDQTLKYRVTAIKHTLGTIGVDPLTAIMSSEWTDAIQVNADCGNNVSAYFNRGFVMSQYVSRIARLNDWTPRQIKEHIKDLEEPLRRFTSGDLRVALLGLLDEVIENPELHLYAALYELTDEELIARLVLLRSRAHIVLANGSDKKGDGNEAARKLLNDANVDVYDRLLKTKGLGHNKFAVVYSKTRKALKVWTGSTNWASTGLCTQVNNAIVFDDKEIASIYHEQWQRLADAGDDFPAELVEANANSPYKANSTDVWFTRSRNKSTKNVDDPADQAELMKLVKAAKKCVLYVMFQPGAEPLKSIVNLDKKILVKGTVSTLISLTEEKFSLDGEVVSHRSTLAVPDGIPIDFSYWLKEVTRGEFLFPNQSPGVGHAITHSKMIVIDPMDKDNCVVITGSHNFSISASEKNDENFVVVKGNQRLAFAYAVACMATYNHYRWRIYVNDQIRNHKKIWSHLETDPDSWQDFAIANKDGVKFLDYWVA